MTTITGKVIERTRLYGVDVYGRTQWGNRSPVYQIRRRTHRHSLIPVEPSDTLIQHITVTYDVKDFKTAMQTLHQIGMERFGSGVSYQFATSMRTGRIGLGNALDAKGTHTVNKKHVPNYSYDQNAVGIGIAFIGMVGDEPSPRAIRATQCLIASMILEGALTLEHDYVPHSLFAEKDCPTDAVRRRMTEINEGAKLLVKLAQSRS